MYINHKSAPKKQFIIRNKLYILGRLQKVVCNRDFSANPPHIALQSVLSSLPTASCSRKLQLDVVDDMEQISMWCVRRHLESKVSRPPLTEWTYPSLMPVLLGS